MFSVNKSLLAPLLTPATISSATSINPAVVDDHDKDQDVPGEVEEIIGLLLDGLRDKDTIVRWSAAKGIGRVTARLSKGLADEIVVGLLELFNPQESDCSWHGACLAVAELSRRGLLLTHRLAQTIPFIEQVYLNIYLCQFSC